MKRTVFILLCVITFTKGQNILPFASQNNAIELSVSNSANLEAGNVIVEVNNPPQWLKFVNQKSSIQNLKSNEVSIAHFIFSVDKFAPVGKEQNLHFVISSSMGEKWTKDIAIQIAAPEQFELFQNYPNPFNPSTTINFQLPSSSIISLKIYDILGKEVVSLFEGVKEAGFHEEKFHAINFASGMYIYQVAVNKGNGRTEYFRKKMILMR